jgi:predicted RNA polymerase sigma factor
VAVVDDLVAAGDLAGSHLLPSVRGELLTRLGRTDAARREIELAVRLCGNERERDLLRRKLVALG